MNEKPPDMRHLGIHRVIRHIMIKSSLKEIMATHTQKKKKGVKRCTTKAEAINQEHEAEPPNVRRLGIDPVFLIYGLLLGGTRPHGGLVIVHTVHTVWYGNSIA